MSGPWEDYATAPASPPPAAPAPAAGPWADYAPAPASAPPPPKTAADLPDLDDPNSPLYHQRYGGSFVTGLIDSFKSGATLPGDVATGKFDLAKDVEEHGLLGRTADLAGMVAPSPVAGGAGLVPRAAAETVVPQGTVSAGEVLGAAGRLGVDIPRAVATDNRMVQAAGSGLRNVPFAGEPLMQGAERATQQLGTKAADVASGFGATSAADAGGAAREALTVGWKGRTQGNLEKLYGRVDDLVDPQAVTPLEGTRGAVANILADRTAQRVGDPGKAVSFVLDAVQDPAGLTYDGVKGLRTRIGEMLKDKNALATSGVSEQELKQVYGGLSDDLRSSVQSSGGDKALSAFETANGYAAAVADRSKRLQAVVGGASDESVFEKLAAAASSKQRADIDLLTKARRSAGGEAWDDVAGAVVSRLGRDVEGNFSPQRFLTDYGKLSDPGKAILFNSTGKGDLARSLNDIATVSSRFKELQKYANPSGTGRQAMFGAGGAGLVADPVTTLATVAGANVLSRILASPPSASSMAKWAAAYEKAATTPGPGTAALLDRATRNLSSTAGVPITTEAVLRAMNGREQAQ